MKFNRVTKSQACAFVACLGLAIAICIKKSFSNTNLPIIRYNHAIGTLSTEDLDCLRMATTPTDNQAILDQRKTLLTHVQSVFAIDQVMNQWPTNTTDVIIWLSDCQGNVTKKAFDWYKEQVFPKLRPTTTVWGTNFDAWHLFANKVATLWTNKPLFARISTIKGDDPTTWLTTQECPLVHLQSSVVTDITGSRFRALQSRDFFAWLAMLPGSIEDLSGSRHRLLCRQRPSTVSSSLGDPDARLGFTLRQLGYEVPFLDVSLPASLGGKSILDTDMYCVSPLLEYLEALFYICYIAQQHVVRGDDLTKHTIVFLINLREIIPYINNTPGSLFACFQKNTGEMLTKTLPHKVWQGLTIDIQPFAYGNSLFDAPLKISGEKLKADEFKSEMRNSLPING